MWILHVIFLSEITPRIFLGAAEYLERLLYCTPGSSTSTRGWAPADRSSRAESRTCARGLGVSLNCWLKVKPPSLFVILRRSPTACFMTLCCYWYSRLRVGWEANNFPQENEHVTHGLRLGFIGTTYETENRDTINMNFREMDFGVWTEYQ